MSGSACETLCAGRRAGTGFSCLARKDEPIFKFLPRKKYWQPAMSVCYTVYILPRKREREREGKERERERKREREGERYIERGCLKMYPVLLKILASWYLMHPKQVFLTFIAQVFICIDKVERLSPGDLGRRNRVRVVVFFQSVDFWRCFSWEC